MAVVSDQIANLLEKMASSDKDFRFMATNELVTELQKDSIKLDDDSERKVVRTLLKLLEDKNEEVQNLAVKCLGHLVNKVKEFQVETIVESLYTNIVSDKEQLRDISSIGLETVIAELSQTFGGLSGNICKIITGRLTTAIQEDVAVQLEALDIITDLLPRFGPVLQAYHGSILSALLPQLCSQRQDVRKRTISACSNLVLSCTNGIYTKLIDYLYDGLCSDKNNSWVISDRGDGELILDNGSAEATNKAKISPKMTDFTDLCLQKLILDKGPAEATNKAKISPEAVNAKTTRSELR